MVECAGYLARVLRIPFADARRIVGNAVKTRSGRTRVGAVAGRGVFRRELLRVEVDRANAIVGAFLGMSAGRSTEEAVAEWFGVTELDARRMCVRVRGNGKNGGVSGGMIRFHAEKKRMRFKVGGFGKRRELTRSECMMATLFIKCVVENGGDWLTEDRREAVNKKKRERYQNDPEFRDKINARLRERRANDPESREHMNEWRRDWRQEKMADPENRERRNAKERERKREMRANDPEWVEHNRAYQREWARARMADPKYRARVNAKRRARRAEAKQAAAC